MSVPLTLLGLLEREPSYGYGLKRDYDAFFGRGKPLSFGQVYATLWRLARDGKVVAGQAEHRRRAGPQALCHHRAGCAEVGKWLAEPVRAEPHLQTVLFAKVVLALMLDRPADRYLDVQRDAHLQRMRELTELKRNGDVVEHPARRSRPVPPGGRLALDRPHRGPAGHAGAGGVPMSAGSQHAVAVAQGSVDRGARRGQVIRPDAGAARRHDRSGRGRSSR